MDLQSPMGMVDNFEFEKKVDIDTLVLYSNPIETDRIENYGFKQETLEVDEEIVCHESANDESKHFKLKMEEDILKLFMELEKEKLGNPMLNFGPATFMRIRQLSEEFQLCHDKLLIKFLESTTNELNNIKLELEMAKLRIQEFAMDKSEIAEVKSLELLEKNPEFGIKSQSNKRKRQNFENQSGEKKNKLGCDKSGNAYQTTQKHDKLFNCNSCPKAFENKYNLNNHILKVHFKKKRVMKPKKKNYRQTNVKTHKCPKCDLRFAYQKDLQRHINTVHDGKKPYKCDLCNSDYKRKDDLEKHKMIVHEVKNPFQCHICSADFVHKKTLKNHIKNIHEGIMPSILNSPIKVGHEIERQLEIEQALKNAEVKSHDLLQKNPFVIKFQSDKRDQSNFENQETGQALPYLQFDLGADPELIAEKMIEGVNIPGMGHSIPVDSSSLPEGWEKRVYQRCFGITKGKVMRAKSDTLGDPLIQKVLQN